MSHVMIVFRGLFAAHAVHHFPLCYCGAREPQLPDEQKHQGLGLCRVWGLGFGV